MQISKIFDIGCYTFLVGGTLTALAGAPFRNYWVICGGATAGVAGFIGVAGKWAYGRIHFEWTRKTKDPSLLDLTK